MIIPNTDKWRDLANAVVNHKMCKFLDHVTNYQFLSVSAQWSYFIISDYRKKLNNNVTRNKQQ